jgi:hypothetical protein
LDTTASRSEIPGRFWNVMLEKDEDELGRSVKNEEVLYSVKKKRNKLCALEERRLTELVGTAF